MKIVSYFLSLILLFSLCSTTYAQSSPFLFGAEDPWEIKITPQYPKPYERVDVFVNSYVTDFDKSNIQWYINDSLVQQGYGMKNFQFRVTGLGENTKLDIVVTNQDGASTRKTFNFKPADISIIYESLGYTPPFYKGRALLGDYGSVRVFALPEFKSTSGALINKENIIYKWEVDGVDDLSKSGYGKDVFVLDSVNSLRAYRVSVEAQDISGQKATESIVIRPEKQFLAFYENNPRLGIIFERAIQGDFILNRDQVVIDAIPYFMDVPNPDNQKIEYSWAVDGNTLDLPSNQNSVLFTRKEGYDYASVSLNTELMFSKLRRQSAEGGFGFSIPQGLNGSSDGSKIFNF